ncbi:MAG TPA: branched-chain amino acid ABC transporter permease [Thermodesulfobacteriota bacterium]
MKRPLRSLPAVAVVGLAFAAPLALDPLGYPMRVLTLVFLFAAMGQAWNLLGGLANQVSLGHAAFFGIGAYTSTILLRDHGLTPWIGMLVGGAIAAAAAVALSIPTFRLRGHYFALATLAFGEVMRVVANSWSEVTGGPVGISVPFLGDDAAMFQFTSSVPYYYIMLAALVGVSLVFWRVKAGRLGYRLRALKENPEAAEVIGVDTYRAKLAAMLVSAFITALLGTLYAQLNYFFDPDTIFGLATVSVRMALVAIVGGLGSVWGPIAGAAFLIPVEEFANAFFTNQAAGVSQLFYSLLLIAVILLEPRGLVALGGRAARLARREGRP